MESQAQRRLHAIQCHLLSSSTASDDPFSHVQPNVTAAEFFHGSLSLSLLYVCMYEKQLSLRVVILRVRLVRSLKLTDSREVCFPKIKKYKKKTRENNENAVILGVLFYFLPFVFVF